ncbi:hypothetical protein LINPERHAP2_LOCUS29564 [Linum perenne]
MKSTTQQSIQLLVLLGLIFVTMPGNYHIARVDAARTCEPGDSIPMQDCTEEICHERCVEVFGSRVSPHCEDYNIYCIEGTLIPEKLKGTTVGYAMATH